MDNMYHVLVAVGDEVRDIKFSYVDSIIDIEDDAMIIRTKDVFDKFVPSARFNMKYIVGYYDDVHTD